MPAEYAADFLDQILVREIATQPVVTLRAVDTLEQMRARINSAAAGARYQGFPVVDRDGRLVGVVTRRDLLDPTLTGDRRVSETIKRPPAVVYEDSSLREAADHMVREGIGRLPVVSREQPDKVTGMITRSDLLSAHSRRLEETHQAKRTLRIRAVLPGASERNRR